jgi:hypothetical protein
LIVEVVSPRYPGDDTTKVDIYQQAGVAEYIILDPHFEDEGRLYELKGYRLVQGRYEPMRPDAQGRLLSLTTGVWFGIGESGQELIVTDARTGEHLLDAEQEFEARLAAETQAEAEAQRAEAEAQRAEAEAQRAEAEAQRADEAEAEIARLKSLLTRKKKG